MESTLSFFIEIIHQAPWLHGLRALGFLYVFLEYSLKTFYLPCKSFLKLYKTTPWLFKHWIALSDRKITILQASIRESNQLHHPVAIDLFSG